MPRAGHIINRPRGLLASSRRTHGFSGERVRFTVTDEQATAVSLALYNINDGTIRPLRSGEIFWLMDVKFYSPVSLIAATLYLFDDHKDDGVADASNIVFGAFSVSVGMTNGRQFSVPAPMFNPKAVGNMDGRSTIGSGVIRSV